MQLVNLLECGGAVNNLISLTPVNCFMEMLGPLMQKGRISDMNEALKALLIREELKSTAFGDYVAIPHARIPVMHGLPHSEGIAMCLGYHPAGIEMKSPDSKPVHIFFTLLISPRAQNLHLTVLARIAKLIKLTDFTSRLMAGPAPDLTAILGEEEAKLG